MKRFDAIYCDFDGTITKDDSVNKFFEIYAPNWMDSEKLWIEGKISSRENAIIQVGLLNNVSQKQLDDYINSIEIDDYFLDFVDYVKSKNIKLTILRISEFELTNCKYDASFSTFKELVFHSLIFSALSFSELIYSLALYITLANIDSSILLNKRLKTVYLH